MILHSVLFNPGNENYARLARVLEVSAALNSPRTPLVLHRIDDADQDIVKLGKPRRRVNLTHNARKTRHHRNIVHNAPDGTIIGLLDCDTMVLGDLSEIEDSEFDLALTERPSGFRYNTGVVFVRVSELTRIWFDKWLDTVTRMLANASFHRQYERTYGGINQSALGCLLETSGIPIDVELLPCAIWNSTTETWPKFSERTKIVHVLGMLRRACLKNRKHVHPELVRLWHGFEQEACEAA